LARGKAAGDENPSVLDVNRARQLFLMNSYPPKCNAIAVDMETSEAVRGEKNEVLGLPTMLEEGVLPSSPLAYVNGGFMDESCVVEEGKGRATPEEAGNDEISWGVDNGGEEVALLRRREDLEVKSIVDGTNIPLMSTGPANLSIR
jgi:hypothetical protein